MLKLEWAVKISSNIEIFFSPFGICGTKIFAPTLGKLVGPLCARFAKTLSFSKIDFCAGNFLRWRKMCGGSCLYAKNCGKKTRQIKYAKKMRDYFCTGLIYCDIFFAKGFFYCGDKILIYPTLDGYAA